MSLLSELVPLYWSNFPLSLYIGRSEGECRSAPRLLNFMSHLLLLWFGKTILNYSAMSLTFYKMEKTHRHSASEVSFVNRIHFEIICPWKASCSAWNIVSALGILTFIINTSLIHSKLMTHILFPDNCFLQTINRMCSSFYNMIILYRS